MEGFLDSKDGGELFYKEQVPEGAIANIIINHGFAEHLDRYDYVAKQFNKAKIGVYRYDLRGHGRSRTKKGYIDDFMIFARDADILVDLVQEENPELPLFMLGHSMGGFITCLYGIKYPEKLNGQIFSGPAVGRLSQVEGLKGNFLKLASNFLPNVKIENQLSEDICSVEEVVEDYRSDPLILKEASLKFYAEFLVKGVDWLMENIEKYNYPCLITHGEEDKIVSKEASINLYNKISSQDKELKIYENLFHEILNENEKDMVLEDMIKWLSNRVLL